MILQRNFNFVAVSVLLAAEGMFAQSNGSIRILDATALRLSLSEPLSSATNEVDNPVSFEVTEDVKVGDFVAIPKGATAVGHPHARTGCRKRRNEPGAGRGDCSRVRAEKR
jgi:hypothetical protein